MKIILLALAIFSLIYIIKLIFNSKSKDIFYTEKTCVSCKWSDEETHSKNCLNPKVGGINLITGSVRETNCVYARLDDGIGRFFQTYCGPYGKHWEKK